MYIHTNKHKILWCKYKQNKQTSKTNKQNKQANKKKWCDVRRPLLLASWAQACAELSSVSRRCGEGPSRAWHTGVSEGNNKAWWGIRMGRNWPLLPNLIVTQGYFFQIKKRKSDSFSPLPVFLPKQDPYSDFDRFWSFLVNFSKKFFYNFRFLIPIGIYSGKNIPVVTRVSYSLPGINDNAW